MLPSLFAGVRVKLLDTRLPHIVLGVLSARPRAETHVSTERDSGFGDGAFPPWVCAGTEAARVRHRRRRRVNLSDVSRLARPARRPHGELGAGVPEWGKWFPIFGKAWATTPVAGAGRNHQQPLDLLQGKPNEADIPRCGVAVEGHRGGTASIEKCLSE